MTAFPFDGPRHDVRAEIAALAARLIADDGLDFGAAKHKAARLLAGDRRLARNALPDNEQIERALREHLTLFDPEHPARLRRMRETALRLMAWLSRFDPHATGAIWKGLATEHAPIHLQLFCDNPKEAQYQLLNAGIDFEVLAVPHFRGAGEAEAYGFEYEGEPVLLSVYPADDLRGAKTGGPEFAERGDPRALRARLVGESSPPGAATDHIDGDSGRNHPLMGD